MSLLLTGTGNKFRLLNTFYHYLLKINSSSVRNTLKHLSNYVC